MSSNSLLHIFLQMLYTFIVPNDMDTSLEWKIVLAKEDLPVDHRTVGGEEEDRNNHGGTK